MEFKILQQNDWRLSGKFLTDYAHMMSFSKKDVSKTYSPPEEFFLRRLNQIKDLPVSSSAINILVLESETPIAWGHLSYTDSKSYLDSEIYVYVKPLYRNKGIGGRMFHYLLEKLPQGIDEISVPAIDEGSAYIVEKLFGTLMSKEIRGIVNISNVNNVNKSEYIILDSHQLLENQIIFKELLLIGNKNEKYYDDCIRQEETLGSKHLYAFKTNNDKIIAYIHIMYNFEDNKYLAFLENTYINGNDDLIEYDIKIAIINFLKDNTEVTILMSFNEMDNIINRKIGFKYLNTNYIHRIDRKGITKFLSTKI
jgi:GNAT superfamily N-acetyltransferase